MEILIQQLVAAVVWLVANGIYIDARRKGTRGLHRFLAFWMGLPVTWVWLFTVRDGSQPAIAPPPDDEDSLLAEVRRDRALRPRIADGTSSAATGREDKEEEEE